ncbi:hypothetical protein SDC9_122454 [bioreactor metagenome]|uniref:Uncharacterized protein n=1 Tax=bioreactor metagenome TaxID=1076179 RepID=A0A645CEV4_9ZZZZ
MDLDLFDPKSMLNAPVMGVSLHEIRPTVKESNSNPSTTALILDVRFICKYSSLGSRLVIGKLVQHELCVPVFLQRL